MVLRQPFLFIYKVLSSSDCIPQSQLDVSELPIGVEYEEASKCILPQAAQEGKHCLGNSLLGLCVAAVFDHAFHYQSHHVFRGFGYLRRV